MNENLENNGQFKMRMDDTVDDTVIPSQVDELRIEKLSTRVTIISIIIPVLIVVVLAFAYMDMKQRVIRTEDSGTTGYDNLSKDMESRFSSLSVRQASLEEAIKKMSADNNKSIARVQVKLKKLDDAIKKVRKNMVSTAVLNSKTADLKQEIGNVSQIISDGQNKSEEMAQALRSQMEQISANDAQNSTQLTQIDSKLADLDRVKIDKSALDLSLKLEILKLKKSYKAQLDDLQERIHKLEQRPIRQEVPKKPLTNPSPPASGSAPKSTSPPQAPGGQIVEQKIGQ